MIAIAVALLGVAGCQRNKPTAPAGPTLRWANVTLTVACPDGPPRQLFDRAGAAWARQSGATLRCVPATSDTTSDVVVLRAVDMPQSAAAGKLLTLDDKDKDWLNLLAPYQLHLLRWDNKVFAVPLIGDSLLGLYRADLFGDGKVQQAYQAKSQRPLRPPMTWDELAEQAAFLTEHRGKPSLPPLPGDELGLDRLFYAVAAPYVVRGVREDEFRHVRTDDARASAALSFQYDAATGLPRIAEPGFVDALRLLQRLEAYRSRTAERNVAATADAVFAIVTLGELTAVHGNVPAANWGVFAVPGREVGGAVNAVPYIGTSTWVGAVAKSSPNSAAAIDLLSTLSGESVSLEVVSIPAYGSGPYRRSHVEDRGLLGWSNYGLNQDQTHKLIEVLRESADPRIVNPAYVLRTPTAAAHRKVLIDAVRQAITTKGDAAAAVAEVAKKWKELDGDPAKARADYRRTLGLQP
ncbi:MAG TPA: extracellular solute-binding protein [Gemmataceae bacterium]|nr:extracellular solute-binding protein [Gemmataceae bacterium]